MGENKLVKGIFYKYISAISQRRHSNKKCKPDSLLRIIKKEVEESIKNLEMVENMSFYRFKIDFSI